nr:oligopeptidase B [Acidobacteriota bacterium]
MKKLFFCLSLMTAMNTFAADVATPPVAKKDPKTVTLHGDERVDEYGWLRDKKNPETIAYLEAENAYAEAVMKPTEGLQKQLYEEMLGRIKQTDVQVPYRKGAYLYYTRTVEGKQYPIYARKKGNDKAAEEVLLDVNALAEGKKFMSVAAFNVSDDANLLAYSTDDNGYRQYKLYVKDLRTGKVSDVLAERVTSVEWAKDNQTLLYGTENDAKRSDRIYRHVLGSKEHKLLYDEKDELYDVFVDRSRSGEWIFIVSDSKTTNETRLVNAAKPNSEPVVMVPRKTDHKYYADHRGDLFYIMTNDAGINYRVVTTPVNNYAQSNWKELIAYRKPVRIEGIDLFKDHLVARLREGGLNQLEIYDLRKASAKPYRVTFPEPAYAVFPAANAEFATHDYRYNYQSFITPTSVFEYDLDSRKQTLLKRTEVLG